MNIIALSNEIEERYRQYLKTTFYFRDRELMASFEENLALGQLSKGPYLEATPVFKRSQVPRTIFTQLLGYAPDEGFLKAVNSERQLYLHQEQAIQQVFAGNNVIVAAGTGSGKTEAFLYPILLHLYKEFRSGGLCPGVRALILYPMNALANDQRERLGEVCRILAQEGTPFRFTFGQYIGETPNDENDSKRHAQEHWANRLPGELVFRKEMRVASPNILLTNYSMLEYLLLRPEDSPFFDNGNARWWTFIVLDEAHQYRGSRGAEMAMLIRRLKQRIRDGGRSGPFSCIGTSATLVGGEKDKRAVAQFSTTLFSEAFNDQDVILGETEPLSVSNSISLPPETYKLMSAAIQDQDVESMIGIAAKFGISNVENSEATSIAGALLQKDKRSMLVRQLISRPKDVKKLAGEVFPDLPEQDRLSALSTMVQLLVTSRDPLSGVPLLSVRYHLLLKSLEGAYVSYWPKKKVILDHRVDGDGVAFEVALCHECGQHYFVGAKNLKIGKLTEAIRDPSHIEFGATFFRPLEKQSEDDDEDDINSEKVVFRLCVECGEIGKNEPICHHHNSIPVIREEPADSEDKADQMAKCGVCGYNAAGRDPVREVVHGADGPTAVIATTLLKNLPDTRKRVLAFTDGRQEAAFFAWYLEKSYRDILSRNLLLKVLEKSQLCTSDGLSLGELSIGLHQLFVEQAVFPPAMGMLELKHKAWSGVYRELLTDESRICLEGVGLVYWRIKWPDWFKIPEVFLNPPWSLTETETRELMFVLLDSMRADRAVELRPSEGISLGWNDLELQASQRGLCIGPPSQRKGIKNIQTRSWDGRTGKRVHFLVRVLANMNSRLSENDAIDKSQDALRHVWDSIRQSDQNAFSSRDRLLIPFDDARILNPDWYRIHLASDAGKIWKCRICGRLQSVSIRNTCNRPRCPGTLEEVNLRAITDNHYRQLYLDELPYRIRVEEHTAQLDNEKAREFQRDFRKGTINVLSCSTTFELGVDLGELDTIFLRNVPPEAFNYAQRVGRAGRRIGYPGFAVTYCRRNPHDLYHFADPQRLLSGSIRPPVLSLDNERIVTRHIAATVLSRFFQFNPERFKNVESLIGNFEFPTGANDLKDFLKENQKELTKSLCAVTPNNLIPRIGLLDAKWIERVAGGESQFCLAQAEIASDYKRVKDLETEAASSGHYEKAKWAQMRAKTIAAEDVPSFLSRKAIIPKYGFPVDVVELDTQRTLNQTESLDVSLQRDLSIAISEFAPSSKLVANKKEWTSYGIKKVAEREWDRWYYARCTRHGSFQREHYGKGQYPHFKRCCALMQTTQYIDPKFGFTTGMQKPVEPKGRVTRVFTTRPYFAGFKDDKEGHRIYYNNVTLSTVSPGYLVVLCEGRRGEGFYICESCGAGFRKRENKHKNPYGFDCNGMLTQVSLGHEFVTDVIKLQFQATDFQEMEPTWFSYALGYAILEGAAEALDIPSSDLSLTIVSSQESVVPPIILYDNVPGGAGLVARLQERETLFLALQYALKRVSGNCGCSEKTSCYGCLRNYRNQFAHQYLQRGPVKKYLELILSH